MTQPPEPLTQEALEGQLGRAYQALDAAARVRHLAMLQSVQKPEDAVLDAAREGPGLWAVTLCAWDALGALSIIAGLFAAYRMNIQSVDVFTVHLPQRRAAAPVPARARLGGRWNPLGPGTSVMRSRQVGTPPGPALPDTKLLDIFHVRAPEPPAPAFWDRFKGEMGGLLGLMVSGQADRAREAIIDRVSRVVGSGQEAERQLFPISVELDNDASSHYTLLSIRAADTLGFLFAFANALTMLEVNIERAEVRTQEGQVHDTFWLTDAAGRKITSPQRLHEVRAAAALIKQFTYLLPRSPNPAQALRQFNALAHQILARPDWTRELRNLESARVLETLADMMGVSKFLWEDFLRMQHENLFPVLVDTPALEERRSIPQLRLALQGSLESLADHQAKVRELNRFKDREMFRVDLRHITHRIGFREFAEELSDLAEVTVEQASALCHPTLQGRFGVPSLPNGDPCPWTACALGKFGGRELGFGSDIEMLFVYQEEGSTRGPQVVRTSTYFNDFVRTFLTTLETRREGIFELDLRLRPYGNKGALASSLAAFRDYYSGDGFARQFERMALVRLRPVAGDPALGAQVLEARDAFVYSGAPLDMENIRHLRGRQASELTPAGQVSAKYSPGGLVDVEYYVQARQIAVGHGDPAVRVANTLDAIDRLAQGVHIPQGQAEELRQVYSFLRRLIDALRAVRGHAKDLTIPPTETREFAYLAQRLQYTSPAALRAAITERMDYAKGLWEQGGE
ncbi:MAG: hypothetical protein HY533_01510 [Chloroflexi bacterium]|nr:hypothetical protein [Chloroflexota bacterium]